MFSLCTSLFPIAGYVVTGSFFYYVINTNSGDSIDANSGDSDQTPHVASYLDLHCLPITLLGFFQLKWVNNLID